MASRNKKKKIGRPVHEYNGDVAPNTSRAPPGVPNPMFSKMMMLIAEKEEIYEQMQRIKDISKRYLVNGSGVNDVDFTALMHDSEMEECFEAFDALMDRYEAVEEAIAEMPKPPKQKELYQRLANNTPCVNLGSGDDERIQLLAPNYEHLEVENVDPLLTGANRTNILEVTDEEKVVVSFNTLTQLPEEEQEVVEDRDGIHIIPDLHELADMGVAAPVKGEEKTYLCKSKKGTWKDREFLAPGDGAYKIKNGYLGTNTYRRRQVSLRLEDVEWKQGGKEFTPDGRATTDVPTTDYSYKNDGVAVRIEARGGKTIWTRRDGSYLTGTVDDKNLTFIMYAEWCETKEDPEIMVLIPHRVSYWRGYCPFHSGAELRRIAQRVRMEITKGNTITYFRGPRAMKQDQKNQFKVRHGDDYKYYTIPSDGAIFRDGEQDFYIKHVWTFESDDPDDVVEMLEKNGFEVDNKPGEYNQPANVQQQGWEGIHEFSIRQVDKKRLYICYNKRRPDRNKPDSYDKILFRANICF